MVAGRTGPCERLFRAARDQHSVTATPDPFPQPVTAALPPPYPGSPITPLPIEPSPTPYPGTTPPRVSRAFVGVNGSGRVKPQSTADPIFLRAGAVVEQAVDLSLPGPAPGWAAARTYSSRATGSGALGSKWLSDYVDYRLVQEGAYNVALIVNATSKRVFKSTRTRPRYTSPGDSTLTLVQDEAHAQFIVTDWQTRRSKYLPRFLCDPSGQTEREDHARPPRGGPSG